MAWFITCEADLNFPFPNVAAVAERISQLDSRQRPVTAKRLAQSFQVPISAVQAVLDRGRRNGILGETQHSGWIVLRR